MADQVTLRIRACPLFSEGKLVRIDYWMGNRRATGDLLGFYGLVGQPVILEGSYVVTFQIHPLGEFLIESVEDEIFLSFDGIRVPICLPPEWIGERVSRRVKYAI